MAATATDGEKTNDETNEKGPNVETNVDENSEKSNVEKKQKEIIERYREFLVQHMDPDFGLLETLLAKGTLSWKEISEVKEKNPLHKRNSQLLNYILVKNQYSGLIEALEGNEQLHIVNYLKANGEYNSEYDEKWPLGEEEILILDTNRDSLIEILDLSILLDLLYLSKVINNRQKVFISAEPNPHKKTEALLDILRRRGLHYYQQTISCLRQSNQRHIADVFESGGVLPKLHTQLYGSLENVTPAEDEIVSSITSVLNSTCTSTAESNRLLNLVQLRLIAAKKGQSIALYIWCETVDQLLRLQELLISGHLKKFVEQLFNQLLTRSPRVAVNTITMNDEEFRRLEAYFTGLRPLEGRHDFASAIKQANKEKRLTGVTVLKNTLFVATQNPSALQIYDVSKTFQLIRKVPVPDLVNPFDIACCYPTECVFISDSKLESNQKEIIRIESSLTVGKRWSTGDDFGNLSVSNESNVVLCVSDKNMLIEYTRDGETVRIINLPDLVHPRHAIKLTNAEFVISHGCQNDALHRVCSVNKDGEVMKSFGGEKGTYIKHLNEPDYLIVDEAGSIFVADRSNKRVVVLDSNLKFKRDFLTRKYPELISPGKMCRCKDTHNLYMVGLDAEYRVLIFIIE